MQQYRSSYSVLAVLLSCILATVLTTPVPDAAPGATGASARQHFTVCLDCEGRAKTGNTVVPGVASTVGEDLQEEAEAESSDNSTAEVEAPKSSNDTAEGDWTTEKIGVNDTDLAEAEPAPGGGNETEEAKGDDGATPKSQTEDIRLCSKTSGDAKAVTSEAGGDDEEEKADLNEDTADEGTDEKAKTEKAFTPRIPTIIVHTPDNRANTKLSGTVIPLEAEGSVKPEPAEADAVMEAEEEKDAGATEARGEGTGKPDEADDEVVKDEEVEEKGSASEASPRQTGVPEVKDEEESKSEEDEGEEGQGEEEKKEVPNEDDDTEE